AAACQRTVSCRRGGAATARGQSAPAGARARRASSDRRRNGAFRVMVRPHALRHGDRLGIVAPARGLDREGVERASAVIGSLGFVPVYDDSVFARREYVAGPPELRAGAIRAAWRDPSIAGIVAVRGGYGSAQVLPLLDPAEARAARKPFVGYSDLTAVL